MTKLFSPGDAEEVRDWVRERLATGKPFRVRGRTALAEDTEHDVLSTANLNQIHFFEPDDMVIGVGAGMSWQHLLGTLAEKRMTIPVCAWFADETVSEVLAANRFGAERMWGGGIRDHVIGVRMINGKGVLVKAGGRVVKNVTGYDLCKLVIGSRGGFGPMVDVNFKTTPLPIEPHGLYVTLETDHWLRWFRDEVLAAHLPIDWAQATHLGGRWRIGIGISGNAPRRKRLVESLQAAFDGQLTLAPDDHEPKAYHRFAARYRQGGFLTPIYAVYDEPRVHIHGICPSEHLLTRSRLIETLTSLEATVILHPIGADFHLIGPAEAIGEDAIDRLRRAMSGSGGYLTLEEASPAMKQTFGYAVPLPSEYPLMQRLKRALDPKGIFHAPFYEMV